jgi:hypothetical protein
MATKKNNQKDLLPGSDLLAQLDQYGDESIAVAAFWLGVVPQCPTPFIRCGGLSFPKMNEIFVVNPNANRGKSRVPVIGGLHGSVTELMIENIKEHMKRLVIRFSEAPRECDIILPHQSIESVTGDYTPRRGKIVTIPRKKDVEEAREAGRIIKPYVRREFDEPAAKYMFMQPCVEQERPQRGGFYPDTLEKTGLDMSAFAELEALLD